jgi:hypothetical protein
LLAVAEAHHIKDAEDIIDRIVDAVADWNKTAKACGVERNLMKSIAASHRLTLSGE